jgi:nicotinamidase-related amidase
MTPPNSKYDRLTRDNAVLLLIDEQVAILTGIRDMDTTELRRNVVGLAKAAKILDVPTILTATMPSFWGPVLPELIAALPNTEIIERTTLNAWDEPRVRHAVETTGRKKLIIGGIATEVCLTFPALAATADGYDVYAAVDSSGHFSRNAAVTGVLRMLQAGVIVTNSVPIVMEMLNDNADPKARDVYAALEIPHATLIGQLMSSNEKLHAQPSEKHSSQDVLA